MCVSSTSPSWSLLDQFEALCVKAVPLPAGHRLQQCLLLLGAARRLQLIHSGQVKEDALVEVVSWVLLHQALQLAQGLLQPAQVEQAHCCVVIGLGCIEGEREWARTKEFKCQLIINCVVLCGTTLLLSF